MTARRTSRRAVVPLHPQRQPLRGRGRRRDTRTTEPPREAHRPGWSSVNMKRMSDDSPTPVDPPAAEADGVSNPLEVSVVAATLRVAANWLVARDGRMLREAATNAELNWQDTCCPICEEIACDVGCPLASVRAEAARIADPPVETAAQLHARFAHPGWEYATTKGPRKQWDYADEPPTDQHGHPDPSWERNVDRGDAGWERFDYTEESYWRRPLKAEQA